MDENINLLFYNKVLKKMNSNTLAQLFSLGCEMTIKQGDYIIHEGDKSDTFYFIKDGTVEVVKTKKDPSIQDQHIIKLTKGDVFGLVGLISRIPRTASIRALTSVTLIEFSIENLNKIENANIFSELKINSIELITGRLDSLHRMINDAMQVEIKRSRQLRFYQSLAILFFACLALIIGMIFYYVIDKGGLCNDIEYFYTKYSIPH